MKNMKISLFLLFLSSVISFSLSDSNTCPPETTGARLLQKINNGVMPVHYREKEDDKLILECAACGNPKPKIMWIVNNKTKTNDGEKYEIRNLKKRDAGNYTCVVENSEGKDNHTYLVEVSNSETSLYFLYNPPKNTTVLLGGSHNFKCISNKDDILTKWYKNLNLENPFFFRNLDNYKLKSQGDKKSILQLRNISHKDQGWYSCRIELQMNDTKRITASFYLTVNDPNPKKGTSYKIPAAILVFLSIVAAVLRTFIRRTCKCT